MKLSAAQGSRLPVQGEIAQSDIGHKPETILDFSEKAVSDGLFESPQVEILKKCAEVIDTHFAEFRDVLPSNVNLEGLLL